MDDLTTKLAEALRLISFASMDRGARDTATEALRLYEQAKAQPVQDERAAFEAWLQKCHPGAVGAELIGKEENSPDTYVFFGVNKQWAAWQARAALAATPAPKPLRAMVERIVSSYVESPMLVDELCHALAAAPAPAPKHVNIRAVFLAGRRSYATPCVPMNSDEEAWQEYMDDNGIGQGKEASNG